MSQDIKVSIITPSYNQGQFIEATIKSVLNQSYPNIEYILVDGGSTDRTMEVVNKYKEKIDIVIHEKDKGQTDAINKGFRLASGELCGWINSDDILHEDCVKNIVELYKTKQDGAIYFSALLDRIDAAGNRIRVTRKDIPDRNHLLNNDYDVVQPGSFYSASILKKINFLDEKINYCMDLDLWLRLGEQGALYSYTEKPLAAIRMWEGTKTSTGAVKFLTEIKKCLVKNGSPWWSKNRLVLKKDKQ